MTTPIKNCPQPDPPELVMRADGYHYQEDEMKELSDEQITSTWKSCLSIDNVAFCKEFSRAIIAADRALNAPADRDVMRQAQDQFGGARS